MTIALISVRNTMVEFNWLVQHFRKAETEKYANTEIIRFVKKEKMKASILKSYIISNFKKWQKPFTNCLGKPLENQAVRYRKPQ